METFEYFAVSSLLLFALGMLFYRNVLLGILLASGCVFFRKNWCDILRKKRQKNLLEGFRDALYVIAGSVAAGRQLPQAMGDAAMQSVSSFGPDSDIAAELNYLTEMYLENHEKIEILLADFGVRSGLPEIRQFAAAYEICRKNGGDTESVCMKSADLLLEKMEFQREAAAMVSEKKLDIALLTAMPIGMVLFLNVISFSYLEPLYGNTEGRILMSLCLAGIAIALKMSLKMTEIRI